jgi:hypothetical protein
MLDADTAHQWGAQPNFVERIRHWTWCREALPPLMLKLAGAEAFQTVPPVDMAALARAFWTWATTLDDYAQIESLDPVDYAHYSTGVLLSQFLQQRPLPLPEADCSGEVRVLTHTVLTLLAAWRQALGAAPLSQDLKIISVNHWASYLENITEDPSVAVAFLDLFTGREPVWRFPLMLAEREPFRLALTKRRTSAA